MVYQSVQILDNYKFYYNIVNHLDIDYNDGVQEEQYLDDESDYGTTEESEEKYDARSNDELADLQ